MNNLWTVIQFEFIRTLKKKTFWLSLLAFPALITAVIGVMYISTQAAEDKSREQADERFEALVMDSSDLVSSDLLVAYGAATTDDKETGIESVKRQEVDAFIFYPSDVSAEPIEVYAQEAGLSENDKYTIIAEQLLKNSVAQTVSSPDVIAVIQGSIRSQLTTYEGSEEVPGFERVIAPGVFLLLFYALIVLLANQMLTSTTEEKENRVIEMILTTVSATTLIVGKIISLVLLGIVQILVITSPIVIAYIWGGETLTANLPAVDPSNLEIDWLRVGIGALIFALSFLLFTGLLVAIGAAVPTAKEANSFFGVVILAMLIPLYAIGLIISDPEQLTVQIFSYFPLTAPVTLMIRNAIGNISHGELSIGIAVLTISGIAALTIAINTFRYGTLEYTRKLSLKEIFARH